MENGRFGEKYLQMATGWTARTTTPRATQMSLFRSEEVTLLTQIKELNVDQMTPIEALTVLNELIEKTKRLLSANP